MAHAKVTASRFGAETRIRWRSHEVTRIEGLSDAVFAFAVTLLVVSLEVPKTFDELWETMSGFGAFALSSAMLFQLWYIQYKFFRRYALQDFRTILLNAVLLFLVLFYVYPLKFLSGFLLRLWAGGDVLVKTAEGMRPMIRTEQLGHLMLIYGVGLAATFGVLSMMYAHALRHADALELTPTERLETRMSVYKNLANSSVGVVSAAVAFFGGSAWAAMAGWCYLLIPVLVFSLRAVRRRGERAIAALPA